MRRSALRRFLERWAVASLPLIGACSANDPGKTNDAAVVVPDLAPTNYDLAMVDLASADLACVSGNGLCLWYQYFEGPPVGDAGTVSFWPLPDAGDPCAPCGFETKEGVFCGTCALTDTPCGPAYRCSVAECATFCSGRRTAGAEPVVLAAGDATAEWLARMAHLEAVSVPAFARLERELAAHGAPERLLAGARRARLDEERHARMMSELARAAGARVAAADVAPIALRPLEDVARENAIEGCVRETIGAAQAHRQAQLTGDARLARVLAAIAVDETRHSNLAWAVDAWARAQLSPAARRRVDAARIAEARSIIGGVARA
jgi:hypothetical protein